MTDQFEALRLFVRVARTGSFSRAGRELRISQPTASRIISTLEDDLGASLFTRTTRAVTLTESGAHYLTQIKPILEALEEANHAARGSSEIRGVLRIGCTSSMALRDILPRLPAFLSQHPSLRADLVVEDHHQSSSADGVDIAIRCGDLPDSIAIARTIRSWPRVICAAPSYLAKQGAPFSPAELASHTAVIGPSGIPTTWTFERDGVISSVRVNGRVVVTMGEAAVAAAVAGLGIIETSRQACGRELEDGRLIQLLPDWDAGRIRTSAMYGNGHGTPAARAFCEFLIENL
jgi:DNA-binding transcriptional LysR family regulator